MMDGSNTLCDLRIPIVPKQPPEIASGRVGWRLTHFEFEDQKLFEPAASAHKKHPAMTGGLAGVAGILPLVSVTDPMQLYTVIRQN